MVKRSPPPRRGIFVAEGLVGMALMAAVFSVVIITVHAQRRFAVRMAADREDLRAVRGALLDLQRHLPISPTIQVRFLPTTAPAGWQWADIRLHHVTLTGIIPDSAPKSTGLAR
jgi:hypothetical protein